MASERWKRRVGKLHWDLEQDDFSVVAAKNEKEVKIVEAPVSSQGSNQRVLQSTLVLIALMGVALFILIRQKPKSKDCSLGEVEHGATEEQRIVVKSTSKQKYQVTNMTEMQCENPITSETLENEAKKESSRDEADRADEAISVSSNEAVPNDVELIRMPPALVSEQSTVVPFSSPRVLYSNSGHNDVTDVAKDATELAQAIQVTQAVFSNHGLDPNLATEWAMRRKSLNLTETCRRRSEERTFMADAFHQHLNRQESERQFREMKSSMDYDKDWLDKVYKARNQCLDTCFYSLFLGITMAFVLEAYWTFASNDYSALTFTGRLLGCDCEESSDVVDSTGVAWFSQYVITTVYSWTPDYPLCYIKCIGMRLLSPLCIQLGLHFIQCPYIIHRTVTLVTMMSLLSPTQVATTDFVIRPLLPLLIVSLASVLRVKILTSGIIKSLQRTREDMRQGLQAALISLDSLHGQLFLAPLCVVGLLAALLPIQ